MKTFGDFETRSEFVDYLNLYEKKSAGPDFVKIAKVEQHRYQQELDRILADIDLVRQQWNNQSINDIEKSVAKKGQTQLDIMLGQKTEKLRAGYHADQPMYRVANCETNSYFTQFAQELGLAHSLARYHVQFPGEVTAWHTDIFSPSHEFLDSKFQDHSDHAVGQDKNIRRVMIALQDWSRGQMLMFGMTPWVDWQAGDVIYWNFGTPHGAANMGYQPRISVSMTGLQTDHFRNICESARHN